MKTRNKTNDNGKDPTSDRTPGGEVELVKASLTQAAEVGPALAISDELLEREKIIEQEFETFIRVGLALVDIQHGKMYRQRGYATFQEYCKGHLGFDRSHAWRLCSEAQLAVELRSHGMDTLTQAHVRALLPGVRRRRQNSPDYTVAIQAYAEARSEIEGEITARDLETKVRALKDVDETKEPKSPKRQSVPEDQKPESTAPEEHGQHLQEKPQVMQDLKEEKAPEDQATDNRLTTIDDPLSRYLIACEDEIVMALKDVKTPRDRITMPRLQSLWRGYQHLESAIHRLDASHQPRLVVPEDQLIDQCPGGPS